MAIELISAQFIQTVGKAQPGGASRTPFAPLRQGLGTSIVNPKATVVSPGDVPTTPAVLVSSLIRPQFLLENPCPLQLEAVLRATGGEEGVNLKVKSSLASLGTAQASQVFHDDQPVTVVIDFDDANPSAVADETVTLSWEFKSAGVIATTTTLHHLLITLGAPRSPWSMDPGEPSRWIWVDVVARACKWASGARSSDEVARLIAQAVLALGDQPEDRGLRYSGKTRYCDRPRTFDCADFLRHLDGDPHSPVANVNCMDISAIVTTFANALGCDLLQTQCNRGDPRTGVVLIGNVPPMHFSFHELAWGGAGAIADSVVEACLSLDGQQMQPMSFQSYGSQVFDVCPERIGQTYPDNRQLFVDQDAPITVLDDSVIARVSRLHPEIQGFDLTDHDPSPPAGAPPFNLPIAPPIVHLEKAWEFFLAPAENRQTEARVSTFPTPQEATRYFYMILGGFSCRLVQLPVPSGVAVSGEDGKTVVYKRGNLVNVIQLNYGDRDLQTALHQTNTQLAI